MIEIATFSVYSKFTHKREPAKEKETCGISNQSIALPRQDLLCVESCLAVGATRKENGMDESTAKRVPHMRTASKTVAEVKTLDPGSEVTEYYIRQLAKDGTIPVVWAGNKALINLDDVLDILRTGTTRTEAKSPVVDGIRRVDAHMRPDGRSEINA